MQLIVNLILVDKENRRTSQEVPVCFVLLFLNQFRNAEPAFGYAFSLFHRLGYPGSQNQSSKKILMNHRGAIGCQVISYYINYIRYMQVGLDKLSPAYF